ncbi:MULTISPECIES: acyltransferase [Bradyrhizobium]|uniref:Acyltransferase 3 domain-containing protein n=1 Tax=Bradyrhizobium canariense TaxID=255045 RepID=A0ABX3X7V3_9BRAD|nr:MULTISPECIES: acyltransferase [Bradyrhizobium]MCK1435056.1 acyltransferase [Bradyrhizobium sp. 15]MCK1613533.1 acyltransferase [Bradyrhizobium sp. 163]MCK1763122.1 acyltransferase [Bradyrhizobium sp. 136]OSJ09956.1 hypothetical protein BSR47_29590 [Bradyrhizobium canariense]OSJ32475.1 hypothetical protein BST63_07725 [Bradyrhizobium canariense]
MVRREYFNEIVGLRFYLALWVAIGHGLQLSGIMESDNKILKVLLRGDVAVQLFMIVSGFVITNLIIQRNETYPPYLTRRFFRLYPVFVIASAIGFAVFPYWVALSTLVPWQTSAGWAAYSQSLAEIEHQMTTNFPAHFLAHCLMFHGAIPNEVLNRSAMTFLPAAWSISLEWQFYIVAPLVLLSLRDWRSTVCMTIVFGLLYIAHSRGMLGSYDLASSLAGASGFFAIGIASRIGFNKISEMTLRPIAVAICLSVLAIMFLRDPLGLVIWAIFFSYLAGAKTDQIDGKIFRFAFTNPLVFRTGEASYSLYLIHRPVQVLVGYALVRTVQVTSATMFAAMIVAIVITVLLSLISYQQIEKRGEQVGRALARRSTSFAVTSSAA